ncbi:GDP/UDP-N,N'-diacetylbacillosamine 2-epimerase (hydrolysing) [Chitinophaga dinghuensis]|uniref:GDP/UDP-N,N'-diacetylbacillosamine 2-epimerase (Hydrolysing) n=2 Tax=Chitinophaga dinghuensis TaxID=1539050 RepID=A0A327W8T7_9BACT|nr:GDP/UDP-N,N'-diacetylbacillosamine 2-epimerase (hydrolysing) [Chitinophaga dinghuensis]
MDILAGGAHLLTDYGMTINEIIADGFTVKHKFPFLFTDKTHDVETRSVAVLAQQISDYFLREKPDVLVVIGDRFELLPVVNAALILNIPIAHISGGEVTEGAIDNQVRHAVSKMAHLHLVATSYFKENLMRMGEEEWRIKVCGELCLDEIPHMPLLSKQDLFSTLGLDIAKEVFLVTFHTETIQNTISPALIASVLDKIKVAYPDVQVLATAANFDAGGQEINTMLAARKDIWFVPSLGKIKYFSMLRFASLVLGNSSSGLVEVQSFQIPVVNVGKRQQNRLANPNVLHVAADVEQIIIGINEALSLEFRQQFEGIENVYGQGNSTSLMYNFIVSNMDHEQLLLKRTVFQ